MATEKFRDLVHYICWKCEDPTQLGATKLNKIPWYVDTISYLKDGEGVTGEVYLKRQFGPVPKNILSVISELKRDGKIAVREPKALFEAREFVAITEPSMDRFSANEMEVIHHVISEVCKQSANAISLGTHDQVWAAAELGEELPIYTVLADTPDIVTDDDKAWADEIIAAQPEGVAA